MYDKTHYKKKKKKKKEIKKEIKKIYRKKFLIARQNLSITTIITTIN